MKPDLGAPLHHLAAQAVSTALALGCWWWGYAVWWPELLSPVAFGYGWWREQRQHGGLQSWNPEWLRVVPLTPHQWIEAVAWGVGWVCGPVGVMVGVSWLAA